MFIEVTLLDDTKRAYNLDSIHDVEPLEEGCNINLVKGQSIPVKETLQEIKDQTKVNLG